MLARTVGAIFLMGAVAAGALTEKYEWKGKSGCRAVEVDNKFGDVTVKAGAGGGVVVRARKAVDEPIARRAQEYLDSIRIDADVQADLLTVKVVYPPVYFGPGVDITFEVEAPADGSVKVINDFGDVNAAGVGTMDVTTRSGNALIAGPFENAAVAVSMGDVTVTGAGKVVAAKNDHGAVKIAGAFDAVTVENSYGPITFEAEGDAPGQVTLKSQSGAVTASFALPRGGGKYVFVNESGDVTLNLAGDYDRCSYSLMTAFGTITTPHPKATGNVVNYDAGKGANVIVATTTAGAIKITAAPQAKAHE